MPGVFVGYLDSTLSWNNMALHHEIYCYLWHIYYLTKLIRNYNLNKPSIKKISQNGYGAKPNQSHHNSIMIYIVYKIYKLFKLEDYVYIF